MKNDNLDTIRVVVDDDYTIFVTADADGEILWLTALSMGKSVELPLDKQSREELIEALKEIGSQLFD